MLTHYPATFYIHILYAHWAYVFKCDFHDTSWLLEFTKRKKRALHIGPGYLLNDRFLLRRIGKFKSQ